MTRPDTSCFHRMGHLKKRWMAGALAGLGKAKDIVVGWNSPPSSQRSVMVIPTQAYCVHWKDSSIFCEEISTKIRSEEHTSELQSLMRNSYAVFCLKKKRKI